jgi:hypothetical protein
MLHLSSRLEGKGMSLGEIDSTGNIILKRILEKYTGV